MKYILAAALFGLASVMPHSFAQTHPSNDASSIQTRDYNIVIENKEANIRLSVRIPSEIDEKAYTTTQTSVTYPNRCEMNNNADEKPLVVEKTVMYAPAAITVTRNSANTVDIDFKSTLLEGLNDYVDGPCKVSVAKWRKISIRETLPIEQKTPYSNNDWIIRSTKMLAPIGLNSIN